MNEPWIVVIDAVYVPEGQAAAEALVARYSAEGHNAQACKLDAPGPGWVKGEDGGYHQIPDIP
jgi:hypothetical protein